MVRRARKYRVSAGCVVKLVQRYTQTRCYAPRARGGGRRSYLTPFGELIEGLIEDNASVTLQAIQQRLQETFGLRVQLSVLDRFIRKAGWRYKKTVRASEQDRDDIQQARADWRAWQKTCVSGRLVFLDETGAATNMTPRYGRSHGGQRCYGLCDWNARGRINVIGALIGQRRVAVGLFPSTINADVFYAWTRQVLLPQ